MQSNDTTITNPRVVDLTGRRFGRLLVTSFSGINKQQHSTWNCICDCGTQCTVVGTKLTRGNTQSCGCLNREAVRAKNTTHGYSRHYLWNTYYKMLDRCHNPKSNLYERYGNRGITVCQRWRDSFADFIADMGDRPQNCTIDRIDNDGPYSPDNCRWATIAEQNRNTRQNHTLTYMNETLTITEWAARLNMSPGTIKSRLRYGWSTEQTLSTPIGPPFGIAGR